MFDLIVYSSDVQPVTLMLMHITPPIESNNLNSFKTFSECRHVNSGKYRALIPVLIQHFAKQIFLNLFIGQTFYFNQSGKH